MQPMLEHVAMAGVAFSRGPSGGSPYYIVNYDDRSGRTDRVTAGIGDDLETFFCLKSRTDACPPRWRRLSLWSASWRACSLATRSTWSSQSTVRAVLSAAGTPSGRGRKRTVDAEIDAALADVARKVELLSRPHPYLHGSRSIFGVMPDWNPAEIIGLRPRPLSLSLYRELVTDADLGVSA